VQVRKGTVVKQLLKQEEAVPEAVLKGILVHEANEQKAPMMMKSSEVKMITDLLVLMKVTIMMPTMGLKKKETPNCN